MWILYISFSKNREVKDWKHVLENIISFPHDEHVEGLKNKVYIPQNRSTGSSLSVSLQAKSSIPFTAPLYEYHLPNISVICQHENIYSVQKTASCNKTAETVLLLLFSWPYLNT